MNLPEADPDFEALLNYLKHHLGCDLTGYKRSTLRRRFQHRMQRIEIDNYPSYLQYLQSHSQEYLNLLNDVFINVTSFFRDRQVWDYLASSIIPKILNNQEPGKPIRVWSAGCATGQEIYSVLILLAEAIGIKACLNRVQCYATDVDEEALEQARQATYNNFELIGMPPHLLEKYFEQTEKGYVFHRKLRRTIIFGRHNLAQDAPMSKIDLLICRNVLIYFNAAAQASILVRFHVALKNTGFLLLGKTEILVNPKEMFTPVNPKHRVYTKRLNLKLEDYLSLNPKPRKQPSNAPFNQQWYFLQTAFEASPVAQLAVDMAGFLIHTNGQANLLFGLTFQDWNRPLLELEIGKKLASYTSIRNFFRYRHPVTLKDIEWINCQGRQYFDVVIVPVFNTNQELLGITLTFIDITNSKRLSEKLESSDSQLAKVSQILQTTKSELYLAYMDLEAADQEIHLLSQNMEERN